MIARPFKSYYKWNVFLNIPLLDSTEVRVLRRFTLYETECIALLASSFFSELIYQCQHFI